MATITPVTRDQCGCVKPNKAGIEALKMTGLHGVTTAHLSSLGVFTEGLRDSGTLACLTPVVQPRSSTLIQLSGLTYLLRPKF